MNTSASVAPGLAAESTAGRLGRLPLNATFPLVAVGGCLTIFCVMFCCYLCRLKRQRAEEVGYTKIDFKIKKSYGSEGNQERCPVCLEDFRHRDELAACKCKHAFHFSCLMMWLKEQQSCPVCKTPLGCGQKQCVTNVTNDVEGQHSSTGSPDDDDGRVWRLISPLGHAVRAPLMPSRLLATA